MKQANKLIKLKRIEGISIFKIMQIWIVSLFEFLIFLTGCLISVVFSGFLVIFLKNYMNISSIIALVVLFFLFKILVLSIIISRFYKVKIFKFLKNIKGTQKICYFYNKIYVTRQYSQKYAGIIYKKYLIEKVFNVKKQELCWKVDCLVKCFEYNSYSLEEEDIEYGYNLRKNHKIFEIERINSIFWEENVEKEIRIMNNLKTIRKTIFIKNIYTADNEKKIENLLERLRT